MPALSAYASLILAVAELIKLIAENMGVSVARIMTDLLAHPKLRTSDTAAALAEIRKHLPEGTE